MQTLDKEKQTLLILVCMCVQLLSCVRLFASLWTAARQAPLSMGFSRQEYWSGLLFPSPGDLANPGIEPASPAWAGRFFTTAPPNTDPCPVRGQL